MGTYARFTVEERRRLLLDLGLQLFSSRPYDEISIEEIAREAGMAKGLLYHYFPSKRDFYVECLRAAARKFRVRTEPDPGLPAREQLRASLAAYLQHVRDHLASYQAILRGGIGSDPEVVEIMESNRRLVLHRVLRANAASEEDRLLCIAIRGWIGFVESATLQWAESGGAEEDELLEIMIATLGTTIRLCRASGARPAVV